MAGGRLKMVALRDLLIAAWLLLAGGAAIAQAPSLVPALPDAARLTTYTLAGTNCACAVGFAIYGDGSDADDWIQVYVNGVAYTSASPVAGWSLSSPTGSLASIPRPITNAVLTFNTVQTGTVVILGDRRQRRLSQFSENRGVPTRDLNQAITDLVATQRELWDKSNRSVVGQPGDILLPLPSVAARAGQYLCFDSNGNPITCVSATPAAITLPGSSVNGNNVCFAGTTGRSFSDCGYKANPVYTNVVTVCGADPTGVADSAPAFRACLASNSIMVVPPGTYNFCSTVSPPAYLAAYLNPAVLVQSMSNFEIIGYGATINVCNAIAYSTVFQFDQDTSFSFRGFQINPNSAGLTGMQTSTGVSLSNDINFHIEDISFGPGLTAQAFYADWIINGSFEHINIVAGDCVDFAFMLHISFDDWNANGGTSGQVCFDVVNDVVNAGNNRTGVAYTQTDDITVTRFNITNYNSPIYLTTGRHMKFSHNYIHGNPGGHGGAGVGLGYDIQYINGGSFTSVGVPPFGIVIDGDIIATNGAVNAGEGILIDPSAIVNSDTISDISINNTIFDNNTNTGIAATTATALTNVSFGAGNIFSGASQTQTMNAPFIAAASSSTLPRPPTTNTGATYTQLQGDYSLIANASGTQTITLLSAAANPGRQLQLLTIAAQAVVSASSNVVPLTGGAAGTAILAGTAGKWATLQSNGTNWQIMSSN
jgi:hypothetical protein